jgi:hypothetical protein
MGARVITPIRINTPQVQPEGWVQLRRMTWGEHRDWIARYQSLPDGGTRIDLLLEFFDAFVMDWNMVDREGDALPCVSKSVWALLDGEYSEMLFTVLLGHLRGDFSVSTADTKN